MVKALGVDEAGRLIVRETSGTYPKTTCVSSPALRTFKTGASVSIWFTATCHDSPDAHYSIRLLYFFTFFKLCFCIAKNLKSLKS